MKGRKIVKEIILSLILFRILRSLIWNFGGGSFWKMTMLTENKIWDNSRQGIDRVLEDMRWLQLIQDGIQRLAS